MPKYVVFNTVNIDGIGDYSHFEDIIKYLRKKPVFSEVVFIPIIEIIENKHPNPAKREKILRKLKELGIPFYFGNEEEHTDFLKDAHLVELLKSADQALAISFGTSLVRKYKPFLKAGIPIKFIGEHEQEMTVNLEANEINRTMGLSNKLYFGSPACGIKIQDITQLENSESWDIIAKTNPDFAHKVLDCAQVANCTELTNKQVIIPAYFSRNWDFIEFLRIFSLNNTYNLEKDILVVHSGHNFVKWLEGEQPAHYAVDLEQKESFIPQLFKKGFIKTIEIHQAGAEKPHIIECNSSATINIRILSGFNLDDSSFDALYQLAQFAGVSGDNTLERCVSMNVFPFYCSTNFEKKRGTLNALNEITQLPEISISEETRKCYMAYFDLKSIDYNYQHHSFSLYNRKLRPECYSNLDLKGMVDAWPAVTDYLRKNKNLYNILEEIVLENLPDVANTEKGLQNQNDNAFFQPNKDISNTDDVPSIVQNNVN